MTSRLDDLWGRLAQYQIVTGNRPGLHTTNSPWYIKLLLAISGWIAALFLIAFVVSEFSGLLKSIAACALFGSALLLLAYYALKYGGQEFLEHAGLALSLSGQAFIVYAIARTFEHQFTLTVSLIALLESALFFIMQSYTHRIFSALAGLLALYVALNFTAFEDVTRRVSGINHALLIAAYAFLAAWLWLNEFRVAKNYDRYHALSWGVSIALVSLGTFAIFMPTARFTGVEYASPALNWLCEALLGLVLAWVVIRILKRKESLSPRIRFACFFGVIVGSLISLAAPGIVLALILIIVGYQQQNRLLLSVGFIALGAYLAKYYYVLEQSLAFKSAVLFICGIGCLLFRVLMHRLGDRPAAGKGVSL